MAGIYVHIPFCATRCIYCDFYSTTIHDKGPQFVEALVREMEERKDYLHEPVRTVYLGGGTPSQLGDECISEILKALAQHYDLTQCEEITMEANPEDIYNAHFRLDHPGLNINRFSLGVQSMIDAELKLLNRRHTAEHVRIAVSKLREAGCHNISLDLMYGLPGQTLASWEYSIDELLKLEPEHISAYNLMIEEGTRLYKAVEKGELTPCDDETCLEMAALLRSKLKAAGMVQYEISNYARPGYHSRHNSSYWVQTPYLGLGPGAHSYDGNRRRSWNEPFVMRYLKGIREEREEELTDIDLYNERIMLGLRTRHGVGLDEPLVARYRPEVEEAIASLLSRELIEIKRVPNSDEETGTQYLCLTETGLALGDEVIRELMVLR